mmetsp:Transcript_8974/g.9586  ORF Transcript_8974/g.9586 Transcript_8974/m.9586 type:complete len:152 (-) Transcript_8974:58-513(-)
MSVRIYYKARSPPRSVPCGTWKHSIWVRTMDCMAMFRRKFVRQCTGVPPIYVLVWMMTMQSMRDPRYMSSFTISVSIVPSIVIAVITVVAAVVVVAEGRRITNAVQRNGTQTKGTKQRMRIQRNDVNTFEFILPYSCSCCENKKNANHTPY